MIRPREDGQEVLEENNNAEQSIVQSEAPISTTSVLSELIIPENTNRTSLDYLPESLNNVQDSCEGTFDNQTWSRIESEEKLPMASPASPVKKKFTDATYGVLKRRSKVAKGVQTDQVRKRCWRHSRESTPPICDPNGNEGSPVAKDEDSRTEVPLSSFASMSTLRSALPSVNFPRWNRGNKKSCVVEGLTERYLASLYRPYASVRKQLTEQALQRSQTVGQEHFEAHFLGPTALFLRTVKDAENNSNSSYYRKFRKGRGRHRKKKLPSGWPLCSRGLLIVHLADPDPSILKSGDFYFLATPVGIAIKWVERSSSPICERSLDAREFCSEMATLASAGSTTEDDDEDNEIRRSLLVAADGGVQRIEVGKLLDELLLECSRYRNKTRNTRDSWVQTEKDLSKCVTSSAAEETKNEEVLQPLAPLASEEEFCSDSEQKQKPISVDDGFVEGEIPVLQRSNSPVVEVRQLSAIADINQDVLNSQVAVMPGSRDICCRTIVYISLEKIPLHSVNAIQLAELLLYFQSIPKRETMCLGFLAIVDGREANSEDWSILHKALALVEECVPGTVSLVLALHRQSHKSELLSSRFPIFHIKFEPIVNDNQLLRYVVKDQLLPSFGGTFDYDHENWINFHEFLDPFIVSCHQTGCRIVKLIQDMRGGQLPSALSNDLIEQQKKQILEVLENEQLKFLEENGSNFLSQLENYRKDFNSGPDYEEAVEKSKMLYKQLKKVVQRLARLADKRLNKLQECMMMKIFEEESSQVLAWLRRKGEETLKRHKTLAETLNAIREQENEFEKFYFLAMQQIERGNDLLEEIPKHKESSDENEISAHLRRQLDDFTDRLEDAREKLEDTSRCYQLLDKVYEWALETMRYVSHMKVDSTTSIHTLVTILKRLDTYLQTHPYLEDDVFEEMVNLASKLGNERLLNQCQTAKVKYQETVDLVHARCETLQKAKEQMACDERLNLNESLDDLKIKPCLWNPLAPSTPHRTISQNFLNGLNSPNGFQLLQRESLGSYTAFPSSYYPSPSFKERLMNLSQKKTRFDYFAKRGSLTDDVVMNHQGSINDGDTVPSNNLRGRKSFPFSSTDSVNNLNSDTLKSTLTFQQNGIKNSRLFENRNWKVFEEELKKFHNEVREQNHMLEQQTLGQNEHFSGKNNSKEERQFNTSFSSPSYSVTNTEEFQKPTLVNSHLMRCASCSDFEELLSSKSIDLDPSKNKINNRTLKLIMMEMIQTERDYVKSLGYIIENYVPLLQSNNISQMLRSQRNVIFGNIEKIYEFHNCYFLRELEQCESMPYNVGECFLKYETQFYLYALYNKNKPKSDALMAEYGNSFFKKKQQELGDKMDLASYLLKPVQRMGKYALLLKQLLKECPESSSDFYNNLKAAEEMVCFQLRHGNDLLAMDALRECDVNIKEQGRLLRQDEFLVWQGKSKKALRHVFLFEDLILFSKAKRDPECKGHDSYQYKNSIKTSDLGLTAQVGESPSKFEIWFRKCKAQDLYVLQAPSAEVKNAWVEEITSLLWKQAERNRKLRLQEMSSMGIGNKPCLDIIPSRDQICDRSISLQQLNKVPRFRNSIAVSSSDNFNNNELRRRPLSVISLGGSSSSGECHGSTFYDTSDPLVEVEEQVVETDKRRSMAQQSQCSAESGIFTDLSTSGDSYVENVQRLKTVERSDSVISHTSYTSVEAIHSHPKHEEISTVISSSPGVEV